MSHSVVRLGPLIETPQTILVMGLGGLGYARVGVDVGSYNMIVK